jgi:hypothetical protein
MGHDESDGRKGGEFHFDTGNSMILTREKLEEVYKLLSNHYVEDDEAMFRFNYSVSFLNWYVQC